MDAGAFVSLCGSDGVMNLGACAAVIDTKLGVGVDVTIGPCRFV